MQEQTPHSGSPLLDRARSMLDQLLHMAQTRLEMLSIEIQREKLALAAQLKLAIAAAMLAWLAGFALILWVALAVEPALRFKLLGGLFAVLFAAAIVCLIALKRHAHRQPLFSRLIQQLQMDRASVGQEP